MSTRTKERDVREVIYQPPADTLQVWFEWDRPSFNRHVQDGLYEIRDLEDNDHLLGYEIVNFQHYASMHTELRALADAFTRFPGEEVVWRPGPGSGLQQLLTA